MTQQLTAESLRGLLHYDPEMGVFTWLKTLSTAVPVGSVAGGAGLSHGYRQIRINGQLYQAHRLVWLHMTGAWPAAFIDHRNGNKADNRWCNLREATNSQNQQNTSRTSANNSGVKGVWWDKSYRKWRAQIKAGGRVRHLGRFDDLDAADLAYRTAAEHYFGEFARSA